MVLAVATLMPLPPAEAQLPPDAPWRTLTTEHFRVTFPAELESLGRRAGAAGERAWAELAAQLPDPGGRVDLVVTDHVDGSNGYASVAPLRRIVVYARPPVDGFALSYYDDWMELVVTHELAHVFHLDVTSRLGGLLRGVFGRVPGAWPIFPQAATPRWVIEGLATWYESALTGAGRTEGTYHEMVLRTAALEGTLPGIDAVSGESQVWPAGDRPYVYGAAFFDWLLARHGAERMRAFVEAVGGQWIPYRLNSAARDAFGVSFSEAWREWTKALTAEVGAARRDVARRAPLTVTQPLTRGARLALHPSPSPDGTRVLYARYDGLSDPQLRLTAPDGSDARMLTRTNGLSFFSWVPDGGIVLAQLEFVDPYRVRSDLWRLDTTGTLTRLTTGGRLDQPAVTPDGRAAVAIRTVGGTTELVRVELATGDIETLTGADPDVHWAFPALSPDGRWIAAAHWRRGGSFDVVLLGSDGQLAHEVTDDGAVDVSPTWSADGRWLLWSSDRTGIPNLMAVSVDPVDGRPGPVRQVTNVLTGIAHPAVDPTGRWIYGSVYHADGWDVERLAFDPERWTDAFPEDPRFGAAAAAAPPPPARGPVRPYRPTLVPRYWEPLLRGGVVASTPGRDVELLGPSVGFATAAADAVGRHALSISALFSTTGARLDGALAYAYAGLGNPVLSVALEQAWDGGGPLFGRAAPPGVDTLYLRERERRIRAEATTLLRRYRLSGSLSLSAGLVWERSELLDRDRSPAVGYAPTRPDGRLGDLRVTAALSSARAHPLSISLEEGAAMLVRAGARRALSLVDSLRGVPGVDRSYRELLASGRLYLPLRRIGLDRHVVALRGSGGGAAGPGADRSHFDVGGASGDRTHPAGRSLFGGSAYFFPVRGYASGARSGRWAWSGSAEYRFPLARVDRGWRLLPLHLDQIHGSLFLDGGNAWGAALGGAASLFENRRREALTSAGGELSADLTAFFDVALPLRIGVAFPLVRGFGPSLYLRLGASF